MLQNKLSNYDIILASASPRRRQLLEEIGIKFTVQKVDVEENYPIDYPVEKVAQYISEVKAATFNAREIKRNTLIITADTVVALGDKILGKPKDTEHAFQILRELSGHKHQVITGVTLRTISKRHSFSVRTDVYFKRLTDEEINYYIKNFMPMDKAGAYGIQEWIGHIAIDKIEGSYFNVMGLPTHRLYEELDKFISDDQISKPKLKFDL